MDVSRNEESHVSDSTSLFMALIIDHNLLAKSILTYDLY